MLLTTSWKNPDLISFMIGLSKSDAVDVINILSLKLPENSET